MGAYTANMAWLAMASAVAGAQYAVTHLFR